MQSHRSDVELTSIKIGTSAGFIAVTTALVSCIFQVYSSKGDCARLADI